MVQGPVAWNEDDILSPSGRMAERAALHAVELPVYPRKKPGQHSRRGAPTHASLRYEGQAHGDSIVFVNEGDYEWAQKVLEGRAPDECA